jgi:TPR repeat protein
VGKAADAGNTSAMNNLGSLLLANQWDPPQLDQARTWWEKAAEAGNTDAMYNLDLLLTNHLNPPQPRRAGGRGATGRGGVLPGRLVRPCTRFESSSIDTTATPICC